VCEICHQKASFLWRLKPVGHGSRFRVGEVKGTSSALRIAGTPRRWMRGCSAAGACRLQASIGAAFDNRPPDRDVRLREPVLPAGLTPLVQQHDHNASKIACGRVAGCQVSRYALQMDGLVRTQRAGFTDLSIAGLLRRFGSRNATLRAAVLYCSPTRSLRHSMDTNLHVEPPLPRTLAQAH
jgi:hypothetical protein